MVRARYIVWLLALSAIISTTFASPQISLAKVSFKLNYVRDGEKLHRVLHSADADTVSNIATTEGFGASNGDKIAVQASFTDANGNAVFPQQLFLRLANQRTQEDNLFLLKRRGREARVEIALRDEIRADAQFWRRDDIYAVEVVMGDVGLTPSVTWTVTKRMRFTEDAEPMFRRAAGGVFDFDVSVRKGLLPEFESPVPEAERRAPLAVVLVALVAVVAPLGGLAVAWGKLGVFPLIVPEKERAAAVGFQICLLGHVGALVMFWVRWNIVTTWKVMGLLMVPTVLVGRRVLGEGEEKR